MGLFVEAVAEVGEFRVEQREEFLVGQTAPVLGVEGFVAGGADAALHGFRIGDAREHRGHPVTEFNPGVRGGEDLRVHLQAVPEFGPEPFRGIGVAALGDVLRSVLGRQFRDFGGLAPAGVILPQPALGVEVFCPLFIGGEGAVRGVHGNRAGPGRIHAETDDLGGVEALLLLRLGEGALHGFFEAEEIIGGRLAGDIVVARIEQYALRAAGIVDDAGAEFLAVLAAHHEGAD